MSASYDQLCLLDKETMFLHFEKLPQPVTAIAQGGINLVRIPLVAIIGGSATYILFDGALDAAIKVISETKCIGNAIIKCHLPLKHGFSEKNVTWLLNQFSDEECSKLFCADLLAAQGKSTTAKRWLKITYHHLTNPSHCMSTTVKLSQACRVADAKTISAALLSL